MSQCDFCPCPTCGILAKRGTIDARLRKESLEASERKAECTKLRTKIAELKDKSAGLEAEVEKYRDRSRTLKEKVRRLQRQVDDEHEQFDDSYEYGASNDSVVDLSKFISQNLENRPASVNPTRLFNCIHRSYQCWKTLDTLMLVATALASNWFTSNQDNRLREWIDDLRTVD